MSFNNVQLQHVFSCVFQRFLPCLLGLCEVVAFLVCRARPCLQGPFPSWKVAESVPLVQASAEGVRCTKCKKTVKNRPCLKYLRKWYMQTLHKQNERERLGPKQTRKMNASWDGNYEVVRISKLRVINRAKSPELAQVRPNWFRAAPIPETRSNRRASGI